MLELREIVECQSCQRRTGCVLAKAFDYLPKGLFEPCWFGSGEFLKPLHHGRNAAGASSRRFTQIRGVRKGM
jgi:hypothetical protein